MLTWQWRMRILGASEGQSVVGIYVHSMLELKNSYWYGDPHLNSSRGDEDFNFCV